MFKPSQLINRALNKPRLSILILVLALAFGILGLDVVRAWTEPASVPPAGNVAAPINVGIDHQVKNGPISTTILYDSNDSAYYLDPNNLSNVSTLKVGKDGGGGYLILAKMDEVSEGGEIQWNSAATAWNWHQDVNGDRMRFWSDKSPTGDYLQIEDDGNIIINKGNLGIGITNPTAKLEVSGQIKAASGDTGGVKIGNGKIWWDSINGRLVIEVQ